MSTPAPQQDWFTFLYQELHAIAAAMMCAHALHANRLDDEACLVLHQSGEPVTLRWDELHLDRASVMRRQFYDQR